MTPTSSSCSACGSENRSDRRFCRTCGSQLGYGCPSCGAANDPGDRFCGTCGNALDSLAATRRSTAPIASQPAGTDQPMLERRLVSVLFADLVGSTSMAEGADVEAVRDLLDRYYAICREVIVRHGGAVEKFIGDAVMAVWGTPIAREDDAERAVRAALDLVAEARGIRSLAGTPLVVRAGVLSGEAAATLGAGDQALVAGDLVNTASRIQSAARPGTVLVGEATMRASEAAIDYEPAGEHEFKGKTAPVALWLATRVGAGRLGSGRGTRLEPPFVGRDDEQRMLKELFLQTARERRARLVSITGIGGIGKSRLAWELEKYLDGLVETVYWHEGRSPSYGDGLAFWALGEMVRQRSRIAETDDPATARAKLAAMAAEYLPDEMERARVEPRLAALLGLEASSSGGAEELTAAWRTLFERIAERGPTVLVFEDLHWADSGLLDFIESLLASARGLPILVLALARPDLMETRPTWGAAVRNHLRLDLAPLDDEAMELLLVGLAPGMPPEAIATIRGRAEGVPLYAVETVRMLVDQGRLTETDGRFRLAGTLDGLAVPNSLMALLGSRLDALGPDTRDIVGHCAVLGISFTASTVASLADRSEAATRAILDELVGRELLVFDDDSRSPERGQYRFLQGVLREVAYGRLSRRERQVRHLAAAEALAATGGDELAGVVATHYLEAVRAASDEDREALRVNALAALEEAAARARGIGAFGSAARYLGDAIELAADEDERLRLREARTGDLTSSSNIPETLIEAQALLDAGRERGDLGLQARAAYWLSGALLVSGRPSDAVRELAALRSTLGSFATQDPDGLRFLAELGRCHLMAGEPREAAVVIEEALVVAERIGLRDVIAELLPSKGWAIAAQGRPIEAMALHRGAIDFAERDGQFRAEMRARMNYSAVGSWEDPREAFDVARVGMERAGERGFDLWSQTLAGNAASTAVVLGEWGWLAKMAAGVERDFEGVAIQWMVSFAMILAYRDDTARARQVIAQVEASASLADDPQIRWTLHDVRAETAYARGDLETAAAEIELALAAAAEVGEYDQRLISLVALERRDLDRLRTATATPVGGRINEAINDAARSGLDVLEGRRERLTSLDEAVERLEAGGLRFGAAQFQRARVLLAPDAPGAREAAAAAAAVFRELGAVTMLRGLEPPEAETADGPDRAVTVGAG